MEKKGTLASPATALASRVFPVPGGPTSRAPFGIFPPREVYFFGFLRKSTISITSSLAPYSPATSLKLTFTWFLSAILPVDLPTLKMPPLPPGAPPLFIILNIITHISMSISGISIHSRTWPQARSSLVITSLKRLSSGSLSLRAPKLSSGLNAAETMKVR